MNLSMLGLAALGPEERGERMVGGAGARRVVLLDQDVRARRLSGVRSQAIGDRARVKGTRRPTSRVLTKALPAARCGRAISA